MNNIITKGEITSAWSLTYWRITTTIWVVPHS